MRPKGEWRVQTAKQPLGYPPDPHTLNLHPHPSTRTPRTAMGSASPAPGIRGKKRPGQLGAKRPAHGHALGRKHRFTKEIGSIRVFQLSLTSGRQRRLVVTGPHHGRGTRWRIRPLAPPEAESLISKAWIRSKLGGFPRSWHEAAYGRHLVEAVATRRGTAPPPVGEELAIPSQVPAGILRGCQALF